MAEPYAPVTYATGHGGSSPVQTANRSSLSSLLADMEAQNKIIGELETRCDVLHQRLTALLPREPQTTSKAPEPPGRERLYGSAGASLACELVSNANDRLCFLVQQLEKLTNRVEL